MLAKPRDLEFAFIFFLNDWETITFFFDIAEVACSCFVFLFGVRDALASICVPNLIADLIIFVWFNVSNFWNLSADVSEYFKLFQ